MSRKEEDRISVKYNFKWVFIISIWTFVMAAIFSVISERLVQELDTLMAFIVLVMIIFIGIFFDIIGIAVATAEEKPFHAMAANRIEEAKQAIQLVRNASQVSNFCNDVIGDISGIISGAIGTIIIYNMINTYGFENGAILSIVITSFIASLTVGGKALGKSIAMIYYDKIIFRIAKLLSFLEKNLGINILPKKKIKR